MGGLRIGLPWVVLLGCGPGLLPLGEGESMSGSGGMHGDDGGASQTGTDAGGDCVPTSDEEQCDGIDNDCDGLVDEDIAPVSCGSNGCERTVLCEDGVMPQCVPGTPQAESCNLQDDDCDGQVDEGLGFGPLAEPSVLRTDEFDTGDCTSCSWAWGTTLAPTSDGFVALWNLGLSGGSRQPTLFGRSIDAFGAPIGAVQLLRDDFFTDLKPVQAVMPMPPGGIPMAIEHRVPGQPDVAGLLFAPADGSTSIVSPVPGQAPTNRERIVWTGERFVAAWEEGDALQVAVLLADGTLETMVDVDPLQRPGAITLGVYPGRVGILVSRVRVELELWDQWFVELDGLGHVVTPAHEIEVDYDTWQHVVGTDQGWLHIMPRDSQEPSTRQPLDHDGTALGVALPFADGRHVDTGLGNTFMPRPGLGEMITAWSDDAGPMHVEFLDAAGDVLRGWSGPLPAGPDGEVGYLVEPHIDLTDDRALVLWHGLGGNAQPNAVYAQAFGCVQ